MSTGIFPGDDGVLHYDQTVFNCLTIKRLVDYDFSHFANPDIYLIWKQIDRYEHSIIINYELANEILSASDKEIDRITFESLIACKGDSDVCDFVRKFDSTPCRFNVPVKGTVTDNDSMSSNINMWKFSVCINNELVSEMMATSPSGKVSSIFSYRLGYLKIIMNFLTSRDISVSVLEQIGFDVA